MSSFQVQHWLRQGIAAAKAGELEKARELLLQVVDADEYNEQAWLWLSSVVDNDTDREVCLENVLTINPSNELAKAGLVHLRSRQTAPEPEPEPPPPEPEPETGPEIEPDMSPQGLRAMPADWWRKDEEEESEESSEERLADAEQADIDIGRTRRWRIRLPRIRLTRRHLRVAAILGLGLALVGVVAAFILQVGPFDPTQRDYADLMRPVLEDYDAWWQGPYGDLIAELYSLCGPTSDGWRNRDVLTSCSRYPAVDCARLAAHCGSDVDEMQARVVTLSRKARQTGQALLSDLEAVDPPDEIATHHAHLRACIQAQIAEAEQAGALARGDEPVPPLPSPACQMFASAEEEVRRYVGSW